MAGFHEPNLENLRRARQLEGLTIIDMADILGWSYSKYYEKEQGRAAIRASEAKKLADLFYTDIDTLLFSRKFVDMYEIKNSGFEYYHPEDGEAEQLELPDIDLSDL